MELLYDKTLKYSNILSRIQKRISIEEGYFIIIRLYLTNNTFYYFLCILFRFVSLLIISGDFNNSFRKNINSYSFQQTLKIMTIHNLLKQYKITDKVYFIISIILFILFSIRVLIHFNIIRHLHNYRIIKKWPIPSKYQIILDHLILLIFPYILEFLSFSYYILLFPDQFVIKYNNNNKILLFIIIVLNTLLILAYNVNNYIFIECSNKIFTTNEFEALSRKKNEKLFKNKKCIFRHSNIISYIFIILQNFILIQTLDNYLRNNKEIYFKIIISAILIFLILIFISKRIYEYNHITLINSLISILIIFCFYSILSDLILYLADYNIANSKTEIIYALEKFFISYVANCLIIFRVNHFLEKKIREILFQEKNTKTKTNLTNAFLYLHELMIKIKEKNDYEENTKLIKFLRLHITNCNKVDCNCKLLNAFIKKENSDDKKEKQLKMKSFTTNLLSILNYLFESAFIEYDYYNIYDFTILLAEHYCHLRDNPVMAFSFIISLMIKQRNKFSVFQMVFLYEISQKYIYYIYAKRKWETELLINKNEKESLKEEQKFDKFKNYFLNLKLSYKVKNIMIDYINNEINLLKYKNIFEETLSFQFDENNESINFVKINFFNLNSNIEFNFIESNKKNEKRMRKKRINLCGDSSNLYNVIDLLKKEQFYYKNIINSINKIDIIKEIPIFMVYKYYLFFDIFEGGQIPKEISSKLYSSFSSINNSFTNIVTKRLYILLKKRYIEQNNKKDSKFYAIYEYKNELRTKYFSEACALKLGFKQKDIINNKIDILMPREFCKPHQNMIKKLLIGDQMRVFDLSKNYFFGVNGNVLFPAGLNGIVIYNLSKNISIISETVFNIENEYKFMMNNNFELIASSKNFEEEYLLNQKIFQMYDLKIMDILKIKPEKLSEKFKNEFKTIEHQNLIRQIKTDEYFIPQFYVPPGEKNSGMMNPNNFNIKKKHILSKLSDLNNKYDKDIIEDKSEINEEEKLLKREKTQKEINNLFYEPGKISIHKKIYFSLNKMRFIENIFKELTKIPDNDLLTDKDINEHNLIIKAKSLIDKLLLTNIFENDLIKVEIRLSYFYDKIFYFISIIDENKSHLKILKYIRVNNYNKIKMIPNPQMNNLFTQISNNYKDKISRNKTNNFINQIDNDKSSFNSSINNDIFNKKRDNITKYIEPQINNHYLLMEKIEKYTHEINKKQFIFIIKLILSIIILCIFIIYLLIIYYQGISINVNETILLTYFYNAHTRDVIQNIYSKLIAIFHDCSGIIPSSLSASYQAGILSYSPILRENYHFFNQYFLNYNMAIGHSFNLIYEDKIFFKLRGQWKEIPYNSKYSSELDFIVHAICLVNINLSDPGLQNDIKNFLFYKEKTNSTDKIYSSFIKLLYYFCINYEYTYKNIFIDINDEVYNSYNAYTKNSMSLYYILEIGGLILYLVFFIIVLIYLYYSNLIIIKNLIFLFIDFSEEQFPKNKNTVQDITLKLLKFQKIIDDFDLNRLQTYSDDLDKINSKKYNNEEQNNNNLNANKVETNNKSLFDKKMNDNSSQGNTNNSYGFDIKSKRTNNSSYNFLMGSNDSQLFKDKLNSNLMGSKGDLISSSSSINNVKNLKSGLNNINPNKKNLNNNSQNNKKNDSINSEIKDDYQDAILNRSNKSIILIIKLNIIIILFFAVIIIIYSIFKITNTLKFNRQSNKYFKDFSVISNRYSYLYYYFNILKTVFVFNEEDERWKDMMNILGDMNRNYEKMNDEYNELLSSDFSHYEKIKTFFEILIYNKNDSTEFIKKNICGKTTSCINYLDTTDCIFRSGIDFGFKTCFTYMYNLYMDYKSIKNKTNVQEIISTITADEFYEFRRIRKSFSNVFYYVKQKMYNDFEEDQNNFRNRYRRSVSLLNIISVVFSILMLLFVNIFIFFSISNFTKPIKDSTYRINHSLYYIKTYSLTNMRKIGTTVMIPSKEN